MHLNKDDDVKNWLWQLIEQNEVYSVYQPIFDIQVNSLFGYEALLRVDKKYGLNPAELFAMAKKVGLSYELDMLALQNAICSFPETERKLFLNVLPSTLLHPQFFDDFQRLLDRSCILGRQIMLEINEGEMIANFSPLKDLLQDLRKLQVSIVLDDVGSGYSMLMMTQLESDMLKIDRFLVEDVDKSEKKQRVIQLIAELTERRAQIVAEGIENEEELRTLQSLGISLGQGYLLGKPEIIK